ncbi:MAG TPA: Fic family protein, partial [Gemmatales bacterium]|nr:Fic family protein [Gemmatales bacterium]
MYDPLKPYNDLPTLPPRYDFDQVDLLKQVNLSNIALAALNAMATKLPNPWLLMRPLLVRESVASSGIENINTTVQEVFEAELFPEFRKGPAKEVLRYKESMLEGVELVGTKELLTANDMIALQAIIEPSKPGIRRVPGTKIVNAVTKKVLHTPPEGEARLRDLLSNLERYINVPDDGIDPLIKMAVFHYQFEAIHPFLDGNGRVGRILMILYLILSRRLQFPVLYLSGFIEKHRTDYYRLLRHTTETGDFHDFILFMLKAVEEQARAPAASVQEIEELMQEAEAKVKGKLPNAHDVIMCAFDQPMLTIDYVQKRMGLSARQTA